MKTSVHISRRKEKHSFKNKKSRRLHRRISLNLEYKKLRSLLPRNSKKPRPQRKVNVVDAAYQYIRELQSALLDKFSSRGIPPDLAGVVGNKVTSDKDVQALALHLIKQNGCNAPTNSTSSLNNNNNLSVNQNYESKSVSDSGLQGEGSSKAAPEAAMAAKEEIQLKDHQKTATRSADASSMDTENIS